MVLAFSRFAIATLVLPNLSTVVNEVEVTLVNNTNPSAASAVTANQQVHQPHQQQK